MPTMHRDGDVFVLNLRPDDENRFHPAWLDEIEAALDDVEAAAGPRALVTVGTGKFWSNGLDLDWLDAHPQEFTAYMGRVQGLLARTLSSPVATVAVLNGHTFAAGAMWALAHDHRVMRADRGYFCLPEVSLGLSFTPGMAALIRARLPPSTVHDAMANGRRFGGTEAMAAGIVDAVADVDSLLSVGTEHAAGIAATSSPARGEIKEVLYARELAALHQGSPSSGVHDHESRSP